MGKFHKVSACGFRMTSMFALGAALAVSSGAHAQSAGDAGERSGLGEIVVTAQKREQSLQDVPIAVTAVTEEALTVNRVTSVNDLTGLAPGLIARENAGSLGSPSFTMRGIFASASVPSQDREISLYLDGVYIGGNRGSVFDLPDVQRIEVLRGPQGTLFGRNATAGAINVITRDPSGEFGLRQEVSFGNYRQLRTRTTIETPQLGPFSAYATYVHDERRGDIRNLGAGTQFDRTSPFRPNIGLTSSPEYLGSSNFESVFAAVKFEPNDSLTMTYKFDWSDGTNTPDARISVAINPNDIVGQLLLGALAAQPAGGGAYGPVFQIPENKRPKAYNNAWSQPGFASSMGHSLTTTLDLSDSVSLKNITSYRKAKAYGPSTIMGLSGLEFNAGTQQAYGRFVAISTLGAGFFALPADQQAATVNMFAGFFTGNLGQYFAAYEGNSYGRNHQWSTETQVNYDSDFMTLTAGLLYYHSFANDSGLPGYRANFAFSPVPTVLPLGSIQESTSTTDSYAAYVQGEFRITPQLELVVGGRVTKDKKKGVLNIGGVYDGNGTIVSGTGAPGSPLLEAYPFNIKKTKPTYSIGVNYRPSDDILLYAKHSTAFLSGGAVFIVDFAPETVNSQEVGIKADLLDRRVRFNLALWRATYKNQQSASSGSVVRDPRDPTGQTFLSQLGVVVVGGNTYKAKGFEAEIVANPAAGLTLGGSLGYTDKENTVTNPLLSGGAPFESTGVAPWVGSLYGQYETPPLFGDAYGFIRLDGNYQGKYRSVLRPDVETAIPAFAPYEFTPGRWILNGRIALRQINLGSAQAEVALWGRNLTDNKDPIYQLQFGTFQINSSYQPARTYGVDLIVDF